MSAFVDSSELARNGVILWRLSKPDQADMWCLVFGVGGAFSLVLDDNPMGTRPYSLTETHAGIAGSIDRADELKCSLMKSGWVELDVE